MLSFDKVAISATILSAEAFPNEIWGLLSDFSCFEFSHQFVVSPFEHYPLTCIQAKSFIEHRVSNVSSNLHLSISLAMKWITMVLSHDVETSWQNLLASWKIIQSPRKDITCTLTWMFDLTLLLHLLHPFHEMWQKTSMKPFFNK